MNPNIPNNSHKRSNSGSNFSPPKRVAGGSSSFQGNAQQAQPHVQAGSSEKGKGREQSPMRSAAETRPRSRASTPQEPSLTALEPEGWAEWFERQTAEGFDWTAYIQETMPEALNQQPRARSGTPQVQSDELSGPGVPSPAIEQSWMVLSPGGEHFQSIEPQAPVENQHATVGPTPSQPGIDTGLSQPKAAEWKPPFEALLQWHMHLGRSLIQREIDDDRKTLEARPEFLERRDTLAERCSAKDWGFAWGEKIEVRESFQPLANILERLEVGTKPGAATNQTTSVREFRRNVSGLHGPGPNIRFNHSHRQKPCELLGNLQGVSYCVVRPLKIPADMILEVQLWRIHLSRYDVQCPRRSYRAAGNDRTYVCTSWPSQPRLSSSAALCNRYQHHHSQPMAREPRDSGSVPCRRFTNRQSWGTSVAAWYGLSQLSVRHQRPGISWAGVVRLAELRSNIRCEGPSISGAYTALLGNSRRGSKGDTQVGRASNIPAWSLVSCTHRAIAQILTLSTGLSTRYSRSRGCRTWSGVS